MFHLNLIGILVALFIILVTYFKWSHLYWKRKRIPYIEPKIPFGTSSNPFTTRENAAVRLKRHYDNMRQKGWKHGGLYMFSSPVYMVIDLDYVKNILTKDFQYFMDRGVYSNDKDDPIGAHLFTMSGEKWRNLRAKLTPTFTSGKMKYMFQTLLDCAPNLLQKIENEVAKKEPLDIKEILACFTTDVIGSCAFGLDCNSFEDENSPFREYGKKVFQMAPIQMMKMMVALMFPNLSKSLGLTLTPKDVSNFFSKVVNDTIAYRERNNVTKKDFMQLLIDMKNNGTLGTEEVAAQSFVFFVAGFETSSTTMTFVLYELGRRPEVQQKLRNEINSVLEKYSKLTYEGIQEMKYMDQVIDETLRMYPPVTFLTRKCIKDYKIPDEDIVIEKGTSVLIPVFGIHYDEEYYSEPEKFNPDRFTQESKNSRHHYAHLPFGEGPRICIGMRFGLMQTKVGLALLLKNYNFKVSNKTKEPLKMKKNSFVFAAEGDIWLSVEKITN